MRPVEIVTRRGSVVDACPPAAVSAGNVETSQRLVDVVLAAFGRVAPERIPACAYGSMNNVLIGSLPGAPDAFVYYETIGGGLGGGPGGPGASAVQGHMTNTLNTPIEALEHAFPVRVRRYAVRRGSGGPGRHGGGDGMVREYELTVPVEVTVIAERQRVGPPGAAGGGPGAPGEVWWVDPAGVRTRLPGKSNRRLPAGSRLIVCTPGGGGWGATPEE
jgi:N-methylhydantoinase B